MAESLAYTVDHGAVTATGHLLEEADIQQIAADVKAILWDDMGIQDARDALADLAKTDFEIDRLESVLAAPDSFDERRVGESLAEHHLAQEVGCDPLAGQSLDTKPQ